MPVLGYDDFWIKIACEIVVLLVDVGFCERLAASRCAEAASLQMVSLNTEAWTLRTPP